MKAQHVCNFMKQQQFWTIMNKSEGLAQISRSAGNFQRAPPGALSERSLIVNSDVISLLTFSRFCRASVWRGASFSFTCSAWTCNRCTKRPGSLTLTLTQGDPGVRQLWTLIKRVSSCAVPTNPCCLEVCDPGLDDFLEPPFVSSIAEINYWNFVLTGAIDQEAASQRKTAENAPFSEGKQSCVAPAAYGQSKCGPSGWSRSDGGKALTH